MSDIPETPTNQSRLLRWMDDLYKINQQKPQAFYLKKGKEKIQVCEVFGGGLVWTLPEPHKYLSFGEMKALRGYLDYLIGDTGQSESVQTLRKEISHLETEVRNLRAMIKVQQGAR